MASHGFAAGVLFVLFTRCLFAQAVSDGDVTIADAESAYERGNYAECIKLTIRLNAKAPKDHRAIYLRAASRVQMGVLRDDATEVRTGIEAARKAMNLSNQVEYYLPYLLGMTTLARMERRKELAEDAVQAAESLLKRTSLTTAQRTYVLYYRSAAYTAIFRNLSAKDEAKERDAYAEMAIRDLRDAIKISPDHLESHEQLTGLLAALDRLDEAQAAFDDSVTTFPTNPIVFNNRGLFHQEQGRSAEALDDFNTALKLDPTYATALANRGFTHQNNRNLQAAEADFSEAIRVEPNEPLFYSLRGNCRLSQLNVDGAIEDYNRVLTMNPQEPVAVSDLAFAKLFAHDLDGAIAAFDQAVSMHPRMRYLNPWRVHILRLQGKIDAMEPILQQSLNRKEVDWTDELVLFLAGRIAEQDLSDYIEKKSAKWNDRYLAATRCEAWFFIGEFRRASGENENAVEFFKAAIKTDVPDLSAYRGAQFALQEMDGKKLPLDLSKNKKPVP